MLGGWQMAFFVCFLYFQETTPTKMSVETIPGCGESASNMFHYPEGDGVITLDLLDFGGWKKKQGPNSVIVISHGFRISNKSPPQQPRSGMSITIQVSTLSQTQKKQERKKNNPYMVYLPTFIIEINHECTL